MKDLDLKYIRQLLYMEEKNIDHTKKLKEQLELYLKLRLESIRETPIINGVDVSKCFHYVRDKEYSCNLGHAPFHYRQCAENPNCYFKQLARKESSCEEMEIAIKIKDQRVADYSEALSNKVKKLNKYEDALTQIQELIQGMNTICIEETTITSRQLSDKIYREMCERSKQILHIIATTKGSNK